MPRHAAPGAAAPRSGPTQQRGQPIVAGGGGLAARIAALAREVGFDAAGIAPPDLPEQAETLDAWLAAGHAAGMGWIARERDVRLDLRHRMPWARSVVVVARQYFPRPSPAETVPDPPVNRPPALAAGAAAPPGLEPYVSVYAQGRDYHDILLPMLLRLGDRLESDLIGRPFQRRAYVDTGPLLERQLATAAGLGWLGKHTLLLNARAGSWMFLGVLVTDLDLPPTGPARGSCGRCTACQPACPTAAFVQPGVLDARRCISYLTIEHRGPIDRALRRAMGGWLFGCDLCQTACPFNFGLAQIGEPAFAPAEAVRDIDLPGLLGLDEAAFRARFRGTPLWRPRREGLLRNALIVAANLGRRDCRPAARELLRDASPVLREAASWCVAEMRDEDAAVLLREAARVELEEWVRRAMREDLERLSR